MFEELDRINRRPKPFEFYTASDLWTDEHTSEQMLAFHLNEKIDASSRNTAIIDQSVEGKLLAAFRLGAESPPQVPSVESKVTRSPLVDPLSERGREVLQLIITGMSNREIAERLIISTGVIFI